MGFLELEKYNEDKIEEYKKERWIEFFGNQPYTQTPEKILEQADRIVRRIDWTKEERKLYDERTRYIQAYLGHLATVEKERCKNGRDSGRKSTRYRTRKENDDYQFNKRWTSFKRRRSQTIKYISN